MKRLSIFLISLLILTVLSIGCGNQECIDLEHSSHGIVSLCSSDCPFTPPQIYQIVQDGCVLTGIEEFSVTELNEDFTCDGELVLSSTGQRSDFIVETTQACTGSNGTTCTIVMAEDACLLDM